MFRLVSIAATIVVGAAAFSQPAEDSSSVTSTSPKVRAAFKSDKVIRLVSKKDLKRQEWAEIGKALAGQNPYDTTVADVEVVTRAYVKEIYGINKKTGKPDKMPAVVFEATITSNHLPAEYTVEESGHILRNSQVTQRFADPSEQAEVFRQLRVHRHWVEGAYDLMARSILNQAEH